MEISATQIGLMAWEGLYNFTSCFIRALNYFFLLTVFYIWCSGVYISCSQLMIRAELLLSAVYYTDKSSFEVKIEPDSNDITEHQHDDRRTIEFLG